MPTSTSYQAFCHLENLHLLHQGIFASDNENENPLKKKSPANHVIPMQVHTCGTSVLHLFKELTNRIKLPSGKSTFQCTLGKLRKSQLPTKK